MNKAYYFGCGLEAGHFLFESDGRVDGPAKSYMVPASDKWLKNIDGLFPPQPELQLSDNGLYRATMTYLHGYTILSWWDRSVDKRPGSNSTILLPKNFTMDGTGFFAACNLAQQLFPWVFARLPQRLTRATE